MQQQVAKQLDVARSSATSVCVLEYWGGGALLDTLRSRARGGQGSVPCFTSQR